MGGCLGEDGGLDCSESFGERGKAEGIYAVDGRQAEWHSRDCNTRETPLEAPEEKPEEANQTAREQF